MVVTLFRYRGDEYGVKAGDQLKCKHKTEEKAREFARRLAGDDDYIDETGESKPKKKKKKND